MNINELQADIAELEAMQDRLLLEGISVRDVREAFRDLRMSLEWAAMFLLATHEELRRLMSGDLCVESEPGDTDESLAVKAQAARLRILKVPSAFFGNLDRSKIEQTVETLQLLRDRVSARGLTAPGRPSNPTTAAAEVAPPARRSGSAIARARARTVKKHRCPACA